MAAKAAEMLLRLACKPRQAALGLWRNAREVMEARARWFQVVRHCERSEAIQGGLRCPWGRSGLLRRCRSSQWRRLQRIDL